LGIAEPTITCPACGSAMPLTQSLAAPLLARTRGEYEARLASERAAIAAREAELALAREGLAAEVAAGVAAERARLGAEARAAAAAELAEARAALAARDAKLAEAQAAQAEALRQTRALEDARRELDLTVEKRVSEGVGAARLAAQAAAEEAMRLKVSEKEAIIAGMQRQIEDLRRRADQGSQQLQGDVLELDLEARLRRHFPVDTIERVAKGDSGADILQRVTGPGGEACGAILWETKRTRAWSDAWLPKLKADQRRTGAEVALLVSEALPKGVDGFDAVDGVWIAASRCAVPLAGALRQGLVAAGGARLAREGQATKMERVYDYLTGPRFRHRIEAIVEQFTALQDDLAAERKWMTRHWAKREMQIAGVLDATMGMYGDLQGIAGAALPEIGGLEPPLLPGADP
jgi:hypothetical protein